MNFALKVVKDGRMIQKARTHSKRRFLNNLRTINWQDGYLRVYLKVGYGKKECNFGCVCNFYNDGWYESEKDFWLAFNAFVEEQ